MGGRTVQFRRLTLRPAGVTLFCRAGNRQCLTPRIIEVLSPAVLTADKTSQFEIGYAAYPMFGAVVVTAKVVAHGLLNRSILWPHGEQERK